MKQKTADAMRPIVERYAHYQGNKKSFCEEEGLAVATLDYWRRKLAGDREQSSSFLALTLDEPTLGHSIEVHYPNGVWVVVGGQAPVGLLQKLIQLGA